MESFTGDDLHGSPLEIEDAGEAITKQESHYAVVDDDGGTSSEESDTDEPPKRSAETVARESYVSVL